MIYKSPNMREVIIANIEKLVPKNHLLRKIEKVIDFNRIYEITEKYYSKDTGRPCCDPIIIVKILLIQHIFGISSLRQTIMVIKY